MTSHSDILKEHELFSRCLDYPEAEWEAVLASNCDDEMLRERVRRLLERHRNTANTSSAFLRLDPKDPEQIGPYRILQRLDEGGMGIVYAAEQREPVRRRVAIKVLRAGYNSREVVARFDVERQALALMSHPNIARIFDAGATDDGQPFIVMEFVAGEPITRYCERRGLPLEQRLVLFQQVCEAVQHAHQKGVIHRDLKPSNILVMEEAGVPMPKVIDFGIAKAIAQPLTEHTLETKIGSLLGTPDYMSPEQAEFSLDIDTRSDVYALGAVLYHLLASVSPLGLDSRNYTDMQRRIREQQPPPPSRRVGGVLQRRLRGELDWIVMKALEKDRARRYSTPAEFAADIANHLANRTVNAGPPSRLRSLGKFLHRHWLATASITAIVVTLAVSQVLVLQKNRELAAERDRADIAARNAEQVTAVLAEIFRAVDSDERETGDLSVIALLRQGRNQVLDDGTLTPPVRAKLLDVIGGAFFQLGHYKEAAEILTASLQAIRDSGDRQFVIDSMRTRVRLAAALQQSGEIEAARQMLENAAALVEEFDLRDTETDVSVRNARALLHLFLDQNEQAISQLEAVLAAYRKLHGPRHERTFSTMFNLAHAYREVGRIADARTVIEQLIAIASEHYGAEHSVIGDARVMLANMLKAEGDIAGARRNYQQAADFFVRMSGAQSAQALSARMGLALTYHDEPEGLRMMRALYQESRDTFGESAILTMMIAANLADFMRSAGLFADALPLADKMYAGFLQHVGPDHSLSHETAYLLAMLHAALGNHDEAVAMLRTLPVDHEYRRQLSVDPEFADVLDLPAYAEFRQDTDATR